MVKNLPAIQEAQVQSPVQEDPLKREMATHSSILAWEISWTEEPGGLQFMELQRVRHDLATKQQRLGNTRIWHRFLPFIHLFRKTLINTVSGAGVWQH